MAGSATSGECSQAPGNGCGSSSVAAEPRPFSLDEAEAEAADAKEAADAADTARSSHGSTSETRSRTSTCCSTTSSSASWVLPASELGGEGGGFSLRSVAGDDESVARAFPSLAQQVCLPKPGADWRMPARYRYVKLIGTGSYGSVCEAMDIGGGPQGGEGADAGGPRAPPSPTKRVAVKRIFNVFADVHDGRRILRELAILRQLRSRPTRHLVRLLDAPTPEDPERFSDLYLVLEYSGQDLRKFARRRSSFLTEGRIQAMLRTLLLGLQELHACGILHRDLKPANCLVPELPANAPDEAWAIRICDFGHARVVGDSLEVGVEEGEEETEPTRSAASGGDGGEACDRDEELPMPTRAARGLTCHVATRWYRAPELILLQRHYTAAVDVWSAGCVAAELFGMLPENAQSACQRGPLLPGRACFPLSPADSPIITSVGSPGGGGTGFGLRDDQLALIVGLVGTPSRAEIDEVCGGVPGDAVAEASKRYLRSIPGRPPQNLRKLFPGSSEAAVGMLADMLRLSPQRRLSVAQALAHPFLYPAAQAAGAASAGPGAQTPPRAAASWRIAPLAFEAEDLDRRRLRALLLEEVQLFREDQEQEVEPRSSGAPAAAE